VSLIHFCSRFFPLCILSNEKTEIGWMPIKETFYATVEIER
jgi:hypothetical protein